MNTNQIEIQERQDYYFLGKKHEENGDIEKAIEAYEIYSTHLIEEDKHIPHQWVAKLYNRIDQKNKSLLHLEQFAEGCPIPRAAKIYKEIGESYLRLNNKEEAIRIFEIAVTKKATGLKKILTELNNSIL